MRRLTLTVTPEQAGRTVRSLLRRELRMADGAIARVKTVPDGICLNGAHARTVDRVAAGDTLTVRIDDKRSGGRFTPVAVPLDILYEDADLLALNKPAGMAVHGGYDRGDPTVANALAAYLGPDAVFHPVNRLDRGTSGVMLVARSGYVHDRLRCVLHTDGFRRTYLAVACGVGLPVSGTIDLPIARADDGTTRRAISPDGQPSVTDYTVLAERDGYTLLRAPAARTRSASTSPRSAIRCSAMRATAAMRRCSRAPRCIRPRPISRSPSPGSSCTSPRRSRTTCACLDLRGTYEETLHHDPV